MDRTALAEDVVDLWDEIDKAWGNKHSIALPVSIHISLFERAHTYIIHLNIKAEHKEIRAHSPPPEEQKPSEKQIKFAQDLGCAEPEKMTRKQVSEWIEAHK